MKRLLLPLACVLALWPSAAQAGVSLHIDIGLPVAPPLVEVQPGIQVVEGFPEEVFFSGGWYWCRGRTAGTAPPPRGPGLTGWTGASSPAAWRGSRWAATGTGTAAGRPMRGPERRMGKRDARHDDGRDRRP